MARKFVVFGVLYLASVAAAAVMERNDDSKGKEPEKKPNIVKDYACLRDGELCHPEFGRNRGLYVSCSNGVAWEQRCPSCTFHPVSCPTKTLWFDGEKCDWASPALAQQPCIDRFQPFEASNATAEAEKGNGVSEQDALFQSLQVPINVQVPADKTKWQNSMTASQQPYFKSPKSGDLQEEEASVNAVSQQKEPKVVPENAAPASDDEDSSVELSSNNIERKSGEDSEPDFPTYLSADDSLIGGKIVRLSDPVYTLVNNPDGSGKQVLMRVSQPFVLDDPARSLSILPNLNIISEFSDKE